MIELVPASSNTEPLLAKRAGGQKSFNGSCKMTEDKELMCMPQTPRAGCLWNQPRICHEKEQDVIIDEDQGM